MSESTLVERLNQVVDDRFEGNASSFSRECVRIGGEDAPSEPTIRRYLAGQSEPTVSKLVVMARAAGVPIEWLAVGETKAPAVDESRRVLAEQSTPPEEMHRRARERDRLLNQEQGPTSEASGILLGIEIRIQGETSLVADWLVQGAEKRIVIPGDVRTIRKAGPEGTSSSDATGEAGGGKAT